MKTYVYTWQQIAQNVGAISSEISRWAGKRSMQQREKEQWRSENVPQTPTASSLAPLAVLPLSKIPQHVHTKQSHGAHARRKWPHDWQLAERKRTPRHTYGFSEWKQRNSFPWEGRPLSLDRGRARPTGKASPSKSDPAHCSSQRNFFSFTGFLYSFIVFKCTKMRCWRMLSNNLSSKGL